MDRPGRGEDRRRPGLQGNSEGPIGQGPQDQLGLPGQHAVGPSGAGDAPGSTGAPRSGDGRPPRVARRRPAPRTPSGTGLLSSVPGGNHFETSPAGTRMGTTSGSDAPKSARVIKAASSNAGRQLGDGPRRQVSRSKGGRGCAPHFRPMRRIGDRVKRIGSSMGRIRIGKPGTCQDSRSICIAQCDRKRLGQGLVNPARGSSSCADSSATGLCIGEGRNPSSRGRGRGSPSNRPTRRSPGRSSDESPGALPPGGPASRAGIAAASSDPGGVGLTGPGASGPPR